MKTEEILNQNLNSSQILKNEPMSKHTTYRIGGPADFFYRVKKLEDLIGAITLCQKHQIPYFILGNGSNILVSDRGIRGLVIKNQCQKIQLKDQNLIEAESGAMLPQVIHFSAKNNLGGLENFIGIPGTVGGALWQNAHFKKYSLGDYLLSGKVLDDRGKVRELKRGDFKFGYEQSILKRGDLFLLSAIFQLASKKKVVLEKKMREILKLRSSKHPLKHPSAGSVFKNPSKGPAGKLIEQVGLKGEQIGQARVSEKHTNFIINLGGAKASDVVKLIQVCQKEVQEKLGVHLEPEINLVGEW